MTAASVALHATIAAVILIKFEDGAVATGMGGMAVSVSMVAAQAGGDASAAQAAEADLVEAVQTESEVVDADVPEAAVATPVDVVQTEVVQTEVPPTEPVVSEATPIDVRQPEPPELTTVEPAAGPQTAPVPEMAQVDVTEPAPAEPPAIEVASVAVETMADVAPTDVAARTPPPLVAAKPVAAVSPPPVPQAKPLPPRPVSPRTDPARPVVPEKASQPAPAEAAPVETAREEPASKEATIMAAVAPAETVGQAQPRSGPAGSAEQESAARQGAAVDVAGGGAVGTPSPDYISQLRYWLDRNKTYPREARRRRMQGMVYLHFRVRRDGIVVAQNITNSSGHAILDAEAKAMLERAQPLPAFTEKMRGAYLDVTVPVEFSLRGNR